MMMMNESALARYNEHVRRRKARELGPIMIKTGPVQFKTGPIQSKPGPIQTNLIPATLDPKLLVTSKAWVEKLTLANTDWLQQSPGPPGRHHRPAKVTAQWVLQTLKKKVMFPLENSCMDIVTSNIVVSTSIAERSRQQESI